MKQKLTTTRLVVLDPGHGSTRGVMGYDSGCTDGQRHEADANLEACLTLKALLLGKGIRVLFTHDGGDGPKPDLNWRVRFAGAVGADALISVHYDMVFPNLRHQAGIYYAPGEASQKFAEALLPAMRDSPTRWCKPSDHSRFRGLYIDSFPDAQPSVMLELDSLRHAPPAGTAGKAARIAMLTPIADAIARAL